MNGDDLYAADQEDRSFNRLRRYAQRKEKSPDENFEKGGEFKDPFSPDYFNSIWEGRSRPSTQTRGGLV